MRRYSLEQSVAPAREPITLTAAKNHLKIDLSDDDAHVTRSIMAARQWIESEAEIQLLTATWVMRMRALPACIRVPLPPLQSVTSITYNDSDGNEQTLAADQYTVDIYSKPGLIEPSYGNAWPSYRNEPNSIAVTFVAGYGTDDDDVPANLRQALLLLLGHFNENREAVLTGTIAKEIEFGVRALLSPNALPTL